MSASEITGRSTLLDRSRCAGEAFRAWLRFTALSFGGPAGQIAVMHLHNVTIRATVLAVALIFCMMEASIAMAEQASFADDTVGASPKGWTATMTGKGNPKWTVEEDPTAPLQSKGGQAVRNCHLSASA